MRIFSVRSGIAIEANSLSNLSPEATQSGGYVWLSCTREEFSTAQDQIQAALQKLCDHPLLDLHLSDLLNQQLPSHYDFTSRYDLVVFRRLAAGHAQLRPASAAQPASATRARAGPPILRRIDTNPVGFAVYDQLLLTIHPTDCTVREAYATKLLNAASAETRATGPRLPASPADMMLRIINLMVDGFLELRRELTHQLDHWQTELLDPKTRFNNWGAMLEARNTLHQLDEICEDQRAAMQDWIEAINTWPAAADASAATERELLQVRSRDLLEHIERVVHHVRRLEQSAEVAIQMHFNAQGHRTNEIMRTLTVLTAIFLPLNLIAGIFGMNFEFLPLVHQSGGFWLALGGMALTALTLGLFFWRKRYLERSRR